MIVSEKQLLALKKKVSSLKLRNVVAQSKQSQIGAIGERWAVDHLLKADYIVLAQNVVAHPSEVDIVAVSPERDSLIFVEVKTQREQSHGFLHPSQLFTAKKKRDFLRAGVIIARKIQFSIPIRYDLVSVTLRGGKESPIIEQYEQVFW